MDAIPTAAQLRAAIRGTARAYVLHGIVDKLKTAMAQADGVATVQVRADAINAAERSVLAAKGYDVSACGAYFYVSCRLFDATSTP